METKSGDLEITRTSSKISYAKASEGSKAKKGDICYPRGLGAVDAYGKEANYELGEKGGVKLGF